MKPFPVLLTFDLDGETSFEEMHPGIPYWVTQGGYGPRKGVYRILDLLDQYEIKATFCVVGQTAERYPEAVEEIVSRDHELACHGYTHRGYNALEPEEEKEMIIKSRGILEEFYGMTILGHRTPRWRPSQHTHRFLQELGFKWNSDYMGAENSFYNIIDDKKSKLLEIPVAYNLDDWTFFYDWGSTVAETVDVWKIEYDARYKDRTMYCLTCHPQVTGRPSRLLCLEGIIKHIQTFPDVEFMKATDYVNEGYVE
ncbi:MAG: polysaccharide deacetylase family protein [Candidatus Bathyarchaeota archaeon]|nr:polysaccharide deacetylase family protein [Candidatus Bathyarchaeota archaeon]